jgi:SAP domain
LRDDEIEYLEMRGRRSDILLNERMVREGAFQDAPAEQEVSWEDEVHEMTVAELKQELGARGLDTTGNKAELQARLSEAGPDDEED